MSSNHICKSVDLALQGGGSHGAFTWGVLDRLLEHGRVEIGGISGTSAGAMNAVVLATGWAKGGRQEARDALRAFWNDVGRSGESGIPGVNAAQLIFGHWGLSFIPWYRMLDTFSRLFSPYQTNPFNINPLRTLLERHADFERLRRFDEIKLFVTATNVSTGDPRVFRNPELSCDAVLASACLPLLFHAVEIDGKTYWDGGYSANPSLLPLIEESPPGDLLLIQINPVESPGIPRMAHEIIDRINEVSFNSSLRQELQTVALIKRLLIEEENAGHHYQGELFRKIDSLHLHRIAANKTIDDFETITRLSTRMTLIERLHDIGYQAADRWLNEHFVDLGKRSTMDLVEACRNSIEGK